MSDRKKTHEIRYEAEIREVKMRKLVSLDVEVITKFNTNELIALDLGKIPSDVIVEVIVKW